MPDSAADLPADSTAPPAPTGTGITDPQTAAVSHYGRKWAIVWALVMLIAVALPNFEPDPLQQIAYEGGGDLTALAAIPFASFGIGKQVDPFYAGAQLPLLPANASTSPLRVSWGESTFLPPPVMVAFAVVAVFVLAVVARLQHTAVRAAWLLGIAAAMMAAGIVVAAMNPLHLPGPILAVVIVASLLNAAMFAGFRVRATFPNALAARWLAGVPGTLMFALFAAPVLGTAFMRFSPMDAALNYASWPLKIVAAVLFALALLSQISYSASKIGSIAARAARYLAAFGGFVCVVAIYFGTVDALFPVPKSPFTETALAIFKSALFVFAGFGWLITGIADSLHHRLLAREKSGFRATAIMADSRPDTPPVTGA